MILLHDSRGQIVGQIHKDLQHTKQLGSNIMQVSGREWQSIFKYRKSSIGAVPIIYGYFLCINDAFQKEQYCISLEEPEAKLKLKSWGYSAVEAEKLVNLKMEAE